MALDNFRKVNIILNKANQRILETQIAKAGDVNGRELVVQITNNGVIEDQTGTTLKLNWQHENGKQGSTNFSEVDITTGRFSLYYPSEMLYKGTVDASVEIKSNGQITNTMNFKIIVHADVFNGEAGTVNGVFISLADVNKKLDDREKEYVELKERQTSVETQFNSIQQEITGKDVISAPEIIAARNGKSNLKERLDAEYHEVSTQLAQTNRPLKYGQLKMPSDFKPTLPAFFYRDNDGIIKHNMDFQNRYKNGKKIYVRNNGNDTSGNGSVGSPFKTMAKAISVAIAGSELKYEIITNQPTINDMEFTFNQTVTNKTIAFISEGSFDESTKKENVYTASPVSGWTDVGGYLGTTTENSKITQTVRGSNIYLNARFDTRGGLMQVRLDGDNSTIKTITTYSTVASSREELIYWNLEDDNHTVEITYLGPDQTITYGGSPRLWLIIANPTFRTTYNDISSGYKWSKNKTLVSSNRDYVWTSDGVGTYKTSRTGLRNVIDKENIDIYGMPIPLKNAGSLADCKSTPNTWFSDGTNVWVHRKDGKTPTMENTIVNIGVGGINPKLGDGGVIYFDNFIFTPYVTAHPISVTNDSTNPQGEICLNKVGLVGGVNTNSRGNGLAIEGVKNTFSFDTIAAYAQLDGFNYHYTNILESQKRDCLALEYNCKAYDLGLVFSGAGSNNATSMHEGASILRIGTIGYRNTGATIIDVNGCYSVLYDCNAHTPMSDGIEGNGRAFSFTTETTGREGKAYLINCGAIDAEFSLVADANQKIYLNNFKHDGIIQSSGEIEYI